ncbi:S-layer homology domain-containing protein [Solibacillus silvestris]
MANQPKKYKKFVATAATATLVASAIVPVASAASLSDISGNTHEEAIKSLVDAGVINGYPDGTFKPNKELTRSDVVKLLGKYLEAEGYAPASSWKTSPAFADLKSTSNEELLKYASVVKEAGVFVGSHGNLLPGDLITRENMALTLVRMVNTLKDLSLEEFVAGQDFTGDVKDTNQAKAEARSAIAVLDFFDITNPAVSNFNPKGNTTRGQFATFLYKTANTDFGKAPSNEASEVVPTSVDLVEKSTQGKFGENVTLTVKVSVKEGESAANIPVTFAINPEGDELLANQIKEEVLTNAEGVATYTYTRYDNKDAAITDTVVAYGTVNAKQTTVGKVYWDQSLTIEDVTKDLTLANGEQKVYQVKGTPGATYYVAFAENIKVSPEKAVRDVELKGITTTNDTGAAFSSFPYEYTTGGFAVGQLTLDNTGKANLVLSGADASATPIVYKKYGNTLKYNAAALQAKGSTVKFQKDLIFDLSVVAEGSQVAATHKNALTKEIGGRDYVATLKTKDGKVAANSKVYVTFDADTTRPTSGVEVYNTADYTVATKDSVGYYFTTDENGQVKFTVTHTSTDAYVTPIVFVNNGTDTAKLDKNDFQVNGEITYFRAPVASNYTSELLVTDGTKEKTTFGSSDVASFVYQLSDQNGKPRAYSSDTAVQFTVRAGAVDASISYTDALGNAQTAVVPAYTTVSFDSKIAATATNATLKVATNSSTVRVTATPTNAGLSGLTSVVKEATFLSGTSTAYFTVGKPSTDSVTTSADSVVLTFSEAVTTTNVNVTSSAGTVGVTADNTNNKVLYLYFNPALTNGNTFTVAYKGQSYTFVYDSANKVFNQQR